MDDFGNILQGGLRDYLDILAYRELSDIEQKPLRENTTIVVKSPESGAVTPKGQSSAASVAGVPAVWLIGGGLVAVALIVALLRR